MSKYHHDISGASMQLLKYYYQSSDILMTANEWALSIGTTLPADCVAARIQETDNGGEVIYLTAKDVVALGGKSIVVDGSADARKFDERFWDRLSHPFGVLDET